MIAVQANETNNMILTRKELIELIEKMEKEEVADLLLAVIDRLLEVIIELKARLNQNSKNSSKPPSTDTFIKPKSLRKPSGKTPGGQHGHKGSGLKLLKEPDSYESHEPLQCKMCPNYESCEAIRNVSETRYEIDIEIKPIVTAHQSIRVICPETQEEITGAFPLGINSTQQYGVNVEALAISLNTSGMVSINRTSKLLQDVFGISISQGTIASMVSNFAEEVKDKVSEIKSAILQAPIVHFDETSIKVDKENHWAHVASSSSLTHIHVSSKRGKEGMEEGGIIQNYTGTGIHDCNSSYFSYEKMRHRLCGAHVLREERR